MENAAERVHILWKTRSLRDFFNMGWRSTGISFLPHFKKFASQMVDRPVSMQHSMEANPAAGKALALFLKSEQARRRQFERGITAGP